MLRMSIWTHPSLPSISPCTRMYASSESADACRSNLGNPIRSIGRLNASPSGIRSSMRRVMSAGIPVRWPRTSIFPSLDTWLAFRVIEPMGPEAL